MREPERKNMPRSAGGRAVHDVGSLTLEPIDRSEHDLALWEKAHGRDVGTAQATRHRPPPVPMRCWRRPSVPCCSRRGAHRGSTVVDPRGVLADFGLELPKDVGVRVHN